MGSALGQVAGAAVGSFLSRGSQKSAKKTAGINLPDVLSTANSSFNTKTGELSLDPSIRANQLQSRSNIRGLTPDIEDAFSRNTAGIRDLQNRSAALQEDYQGNESAFREAQLAPLQEAVARGRGDLNRELGRTNVRGTFANQSRTGFELDAAREFGNKEAQIENQRINTLGDFLGIDADFLKDALVSDTGRVSMLAELEGILAKMDSQQFEQEMRGLGLFGKFTGAAAGKADRIGNAQGIVDQADSELFGSVFNAFDAIDNSGPGLPPGGSNTGGAPSSSAAGGI